jgi:hypothetical protein
VAANVLGQFHLGWLVPVVVLSLVFLRISRRHC